VAAEDNNEDIQRKEFDVETSYSEPLSGRNEEETENLKSLKESIKDVSPYLILLNRLDEEEGVRTPSIEDKLKLAEDRLRISTTKFCKACEELIDGKEDDSNVTEEYAFLSPEKVHEAFRPKVFDPCLRPPQTLSVSEVSKKPIVGISETPEQKKVDLQAAPRKPQMHQLRAFYLLHYFSLSPSSKRELPPALISYRARERPHVSTSVAFPHLRPDSPDGALRYSERLKIQTYEYTTPILIGIFIDDRFWRGATEFAWSS
ncbi:hypothetical protein AVEN_53790-1, partial [Araneus ventricosus]